MTAGSRMMSSLLENYERIRQGVFDACLRSGRNPRDVRLIAVTKTVEPGRIRQLYNAGHREFGENRLQEALPKMAELPADSLWHFIGRIQKNKLRRIVTDFSLIHSVDSLEIAVKMDSIATEYGLQARILLQTNLAGEATKGGFGEASLKNALPDILGLAGLRVEGLMCIPPFVEDPEASRGYFQRMRTLRDELQVACSHPLPELSMGMSNDYLVAVEEGATFVRVGSSLFGARPPAEPTVTTDS